MTPPQRWYLSHDSADSTISLHKHGANGTQLVGVVCQLSLTKAKGSGPDDFLLKFCFDDERCKGFYLHSFEWTANEFSSYFHKMKATSEKGFYALWSKKIAPFLDKNGSGHYSPSGSLEAGSAAMTLSHSQSLSQSPSHSSSSFQSSSQSSSQPSSHSLATTPSGCTTPRDLTTPSTTQCVVSRSRKRKHPSTTPARNISTPSTLRPAKMLRITQTPVDSPLVDTSDIDTRIREAFVGHFEIPVSCLIEPVRSRILRKIDSKFVERLKEHMLENQSKDSAPIVGLVVTPEGEKFNPARKDCYQYETIGGNNSREATQSLFSESGDAFYKTRLVSVYEGLTNEEALRLASQHNQVTSFTHQMTIWDKVEVCRRELYRLTEKDESVDDVPEKPRKWRDHCSTILLQSVNTLDDASVFFLAGLPKEVFVLAEEVFRMFSNGELKGQVAKRGTTGKTLDLRGSNFKPLRGIDLQTVAQLLTDMKNKKLSVKELIKECTRIKQLRVVQQAFMEETGAESWDDAKSRFPEFTTARAMDEFVTKTSKQALGASNRFKGFCQQALLSERDDLLGLTTDANGYYSMGKAAAVVINKAAETLNYIQLKQLMSSNTVSPFSGAVLTIFDTQDLYGEQTMESVVRSVRAMNTMGGIGNFVVCITCPPDQLGKVQTSLNSCGLEKQEHLFFHCNGPVKGHHGTLFGNGTRPAVLGVHGDMIRPSKTRNNLICYSSPVVIHDDNGQPSHEDFGMEAYEVLYQHITKPGDFVLLPCAATDSGVIAALSEQRNVIAASHSACVTGLIKRRVCKWLQSTSEGDKSGEEHNQEEMNEDD